MTRLIYPIIFLFISLGVNAQTPCFQVLTEEICPPPNPPIVVHNEPLFNYKHADKRAGLTPDDAKARYKAFWIFGDGNYISFPDGTIEQDEATLDIDYEYFLAGSYSPTAILVEKKSDEEPPGTTSRRVQYDLPVEKAPQEEVRDLRENGADPAAKDQGETPRDRILFNDRISGPNTADIESSSLVRLGGYKMAFAVSTMLPQSAANQAVVLFLYNSAKLRDTNPFIPMNIFSAAEVKQANYTESDYKTGTTEGHLPGALGSVIHRKYQNVIAQPLNVNFDKKPENFTEFRMFPVLQTTPKDNGVIRTGITALDASGMGEAQFVVLVIDNTSLNVEFNNADSLSPIIQPTSSNQPLTNSSAEIAQILALIDQYFPDLRNIILDTSTLSIGNGMFIRGFAYRSELIRTSIDPTELRVLKICPNNENFDVNMSMTVCNEGNAPEDSITVALRNTRGILIQDLHFNPAEFSTKLNGLFPDEFLSFSYLNLPEFIQATAASHANCFEVKFDFKTDWNGVEKLRDGGALTASVHFTSAEIKPKQDFPSIALDSLKVSRKGGYDCTVPDNCWWLYVVLFALFIVIWWYWKNNKEEE